MEKISLNFNGATTALSHPATSVKKVYPLAEKFPGWSPYTYVFNNPVSFTDPTGMEGEDGVTDPPTKEQEAAMAKSDKENGAASEKHTVRADTINDAKSTP